MSDLSEDAKIIVASNLTLAFFIREYTLYSTKNNLRPDSEETVKEFFEGFKKFLDK